MNPIVNWSYDPSDVVDGVVYNSLDAIITAEKMAVAVYPKEGITPYDLNGNLDITADYTNPYNVLVEDLKPGAEIVVNIDF